MKLSMSNKGWPSQWFYLKNNATPALPEHALSKYIRRVVEVVPDSWGWGRPEGLEEDPRPPRRHQDPKEGRCEGEWHH
jgi:hypothetical protein